MVREGYSFGLPPFLIGVVLLAWGQGWMFALGTVLVLLGLFVFSFFRNPDRVIPDGAGVIVAPADGRVVVVKDEEKGGRPGKRVSIFLAVWNVHVNRAPAAGKITKLEYKPGKFMAAWDERCSSDRTRRDCLQADRRVGRAAMHCVEERGRHSGAGRAGRIGEIRFANGCVDAGGAGNRGESRAKRKGRIECLGENAGKRWGNKAVERRRDKSPNAGRVRLVVLCFGDE